MEEQIVDGALKTAESISNFGILVVSAGFFILLSAAMMIMFVKWFKDIINNIMETNNTTLNELKVQMKENNEIMRVVSEGFKQETKYRVQTTSGMAFDLAKFRLIDMIDTVKRENNIINREATELKINKLVTNLHEDMSSKFDIYTWKGRKLSSYTSHKWIEWMQAAVISEVYSDSPHNTDRTFTNVSAVFDRIKLDFHHRTNDE